MKNALAYTRVSTKEQAEKGLSIPAQLKAIGEYANSHAFLNDLPKGSLGSRLIQINTPEDLARRNFGLSKQRSTILVTIIMGQSTWKTGFNEFRMKSLKDYLHEHTIY